MKKMVSFFLLLQIVLCSAQVYRFLYRMEYKLDSTDTNRFHRTTALEVDSKNSSFFDFDNYKTDSINRTSSSRMISENILDYEVSRKMNQPYHKNYVHVSGNNFVYPSVDSISWTLSNETKFIDSIAVQKAITKFGGRRWIAWFAKEIPIFEGPYKFRGLPGLIMEIYDDKNNFLFEMVKNYTIANRQKAWTPENIYNRKTIPISFNKYQELKLNDYNNPFADIRAKMEAGVNYTLTAFGRQIKNPQQLNEITRLQKEWIRKRYNPIDLDKAVEYD